MCTNLAKLSQIILVGILFMLVIPNLNGQIVNCANNNDDEPPFSPANANDPNYNATLEIETAVIGPGDDFCIGNDPGKDTEGGCGSFLFTGLTGGQDDCPAEFCFAPRQGCGDALGNVCFWQEDPENPGQWQNVGAPADNSGICVLAPPGLTQYSITICRPGQGPVSINDVFRCISEHLPVHQL